MIKFITSFLLFSVLLVASSYNFTETRYSDALNKSMELKGEITFLEDGLKIKYSESQRALNYEDGELEYFEDDELVEISDDEAMKIAQYFEIIILLYSGDEDTLNTEFKVRKEGEFSFLIPLGEIKNHISKIKLKRHKQELKMIKLFLSNLDNITINIKDEID